MTFAFLLESVGAGEWLLLLAVLLVVMGPKRLPATARKIGSYYSKFRRAADSFKRQLMDMDLEMERELRKIEREAEETVKGPEETPKTDGQGTTDGTAAAKPDAQEDEGDKIERDYPDYEEDPEFNGD